MKRLSFWLTAAVAVLSLGFMSCDGDDVDPTAVAPSINVFASTPVAQNVEPGDDVTIEATIVKGDANLEELSFTVNGNALAISRVTVTEGTDDVTVETGSIVDLPNSGGTYTFVFESLTTEDTEEIVITVTDKDGESTSQTITITTANPTTALGSSSAFTLTYVNSSQTDGANINTSAFIEYTGNVDGGTTPTTFVGNFTGSASGITFVEVASTSTYSTVEDLETAFTAGTAVSSFTVKSDNNFEAKTVIAYDGSDYVLVEFTDLALASSNNVASANLTVKTATVPTLASAE